MQESYEDFLEESFTHPPGDFVAGSLSWSHIDVLHATGKTEDKTRCEIERDEPNYRVGASGPSEWFLKATGQWESYQENGRRKFQWKEKRRPYQESQNSWSQKKDVNDNFPKKIESEEDIQKIIKKSDGFGFTAYLKSSAGAQFAEKFNSKSDRETSKENQPENKDHNIQKQVLYSNQRPLRSPIPSSAETKQIRTEKKDDPNEFGNEREEEEQWKMTVRQIEAEMDAGRREEEEIRKIVEKNNGYGLTIYLKNSNGVKFSEKSKRDADKVVSQENRLESQECQLRPTSTSSNTLDESNQLIVDRKTREENYWKADPPLSTYRNVIENWRYPIQEPIYRISNTRLIEKSCSSLIESVLLEAAEKLEAMESLTVKQKDMVAELFKEKTGLCVRRKK